MKHFLSIKDFTKEQLLEMIDLAVEIKKDLKNGSRKALLNGKTLGMIFEKSSTRTRVSFEVGMYQLGGYPLFLSSKDIQLGRGEPMKDTARVLSRMVDMVMIRTFEHSKIEEFAKFSKVPVINGLTNEFHPVQIMADFLTMIEHNKGISSKIAFIGDGNNMSNSWMMFCAVMGMEYRFASPKGYELQSEFIDIAQNIAKNTGAKLIFTNDPKEAIADSDVVTTDVWASMGQEEEQKKREKDFTGFTITNELFSLANKDAIFLHCLPVHRGEEVTEEIFERFADVVFSEAENRLHAQKGIMVWLDQNNK